jgi:hypothetical protein
MVEEKEERVNVPLRYSPGFWNEYTKECKAVWGK